MNTPAYMCVMFFIFEKYLAGVFCDQSVTDDQISISIADTTFTERKKYLVERGIKLNQTKNASFRNHFHFQSIMTDNTSLPVNGQSTGKLIKKKYKHPIPKPLDDILQNKIFYSMESSVSYISTTEISINSLLNTEIVSDNASKCLKREFSCTNSTSVRIRARSPVTYQYEEISQFVCSENMPYCDNITGTGVSASKTAITSTPFMCLKNGYFPHPYDRSKYFLCLNYKSYEFNCKSDYYYNFRTNSCDPYCYNKYCNMFNCKGHNGYKIPYSRDSSIYAYCINNEPYVITKCEGKEKLNVTSQRCEPVCEHEGLIEDATDCTAYHRCIKTGFFYTKTSHKCLSDQGFDSLSFQCISLSQLPDCIPGKKEN